MFAPLLARDLFHLQGRQKALTCPPITSCCIAPISSWVLSGTPCHCYEKVINFSKVSCVWVTDEKYQCTHRQCLKDSNKETLELYTQTSLCNKTKPIWHIIFLRKDILTYVIYKHIYVILLFAYMFYILWLLILCFYGIINVWECVFLHLYVSYGFSLSVFLSLYVLSCSGLCVRSHFFAVSLTEHSICFSLDP